MVNRVAPSSLSWNWVGICIKFSAWTCGCFQKWEDPYIISTLIVFSLINHPFWGTPIYRNPHVVMMRIEWGVGLWWSWRLIIPHPSAMQNRVPKPQIAACSPISIIVPSLYLYYSYTSFLTNLPTVSWSPCVWSMWHSVRNDNHHTDPSQATRILSGQSAWSMFMANISWFPRGHGIGKKQILYPRLWRCTAWGTVQVPWNMTISLRNCNLYRTDV